MSIRSEWNEVVVAARDAAQSDDVKVRVEAWLLIGEAELERFREAVTSFESVDAAESVDRWIRYRALAGLGLAHERLQQFRRRVYPVRRLAIPLWATSVRHDELTWSVCSDFRSGEPKNAERARSAARAGGVGWALAIRMTGSPQRRARMQRIDGSSKRLKADATEQGSEDGGGPPDAAGPRGASHALGVRRGRFRAHRA